MLSIIRSINRTRISRMLSSSLYSTTSSSSSPAAIDLTEFIGDAHKTRYNSDERTKILEVLNKFTSTQLKVFTISQARINKIMKKRETDGNIKNVDDLLELDGFGTKVLEKFCDSILAQDLNFIPMKAAAVAADIVDSSKVESLMYIKKNSFVTPILLEAVRSNVRSVVSFQMDVNFFAWSKICYNPEANEQKEGDFYLEDWHCYEIGNNDKKLTLSDLVNVLVSLNDQIPQADIYVIEALPLVQNLRSGQTQIVVNIQRAQFHAMLSAMMAARKSLKIKNPKEDQPDFDSVYFLRSFLAARFYRYLVGHERVSSAHIAQDIIDYNDVVHPQVSNPKYEFLDVPLNLRDNWNSSRSIEKEYLANSLLVGLTFMKLCIQRCGKCISTVKSRNMLNESQ